MTHREKMIRALERKPITGLVPHIELVFFLTMEAFGSPHISHRSFNQWDQMSETERNLYRNDHADQYIKICEKYDQSAAFFHPNPWTNDEIIRLMEIFREKTGDEYFTMLHGDATYSIPDGNSMYDFSYALIDTPEKVKDDAQKMVDSALEQALWLKQYGLLDGFALCSDYCLNTGPFLSPDQFGEFVYPYLKELIAGYREMGYYTIKHTDGNIMPILDYLVDANPHALHSIDPQAGVDIKEVKALVGDRVCLIGNVNCGLLQTGTDEEVIENCKYALKHGMPGYGYIYSTSNCIYTGMDLKRYELMLEVRKQYGIYE